MSTKLLDLKGTGCPHCHKGQYQETSLSDSWDGVVHCTSCGVKSKRMVAQVPKYVVYADGSCKANGAKDGGRGGWGAVICEKGESVPFQELSGGRPGTTNNQMELTAVIQALEQLPQKAQVEIWTDSQYVVKGMTEWIVGWKRRRWTKPDGSPVLNQALWQNLDRLSSERHVSWHWVRGHAGHAGNEHADRLAQAAADLQPR